jgi:hypothetical protein
MFEQAAIRIMAINKASIPFIQYLLICSLIVVTELASLCIAAQVNLPPPSDHVTQHLKLTIVPKAFSR